MKPGLQQSTRVLAKRLGYTSEQMLQGFVPARATDFATVVVWRAQNAPGPLPAGDDDYLLWRYNFGHNTTPGNRNNLLWLLHIDGEVLAMMGAQQQSLWVNGEPRDIAYPLDLLVRKDLNGSGLGAWINLAMQDKYATLLVIGGGTRESAGLIKRMFHAMPNRKIWKLPVSSQGTLRRLLGNDSLARPVASIADALLSLQRKWHNHRSDNPGIRVVAAQQFPAAVDSLQASWPKETILLERDADFLNWRFCQNPGIRYQFLLFYTGEQLVGYSVYHCYHSAKNAQQQGLIDDLMWLRSGDNSEQNHLLKHMLATTVRQLVKDGARLILFSSYGFAADKALAQLGFRQREDEQVFAIFNAQGPDGELFDPTRWYLSSAEAHGPNF